MHTKGRQGEAWILRTKDCRFGGILLCKTAAKMAGKVAIGVAWYSINSTVVHFEINHSCHDSAI